MRDLLRGFRERLRDEETEGRRDGIARKVPGENLSLFFENYDILKVIIW